MATFTPIPMGGGGGADVTDAFVTIGHPADLTAERALAVGASLGLADGGANASVTISRAALTGDVTAGADSNVTTIANDAVTYAKMQDVSAASRLLGRGSAAGAGNVEELTLGTNLSMAGTVLNATGGGGLGDPGADGIVVRTALNTTVARTLTAADATITIGNGTGVAANPTVAVGTIAEAQVTGLVADLAAKVPTTRTLTATAPITGGGDLSADRSFGISDFVASGGGHARGAVPDPGAVGGTTKFLREDATWATVTATPDDLDRVLGADSTMGTNKSRVIAGPYELNGFSLTIGDGAVLAVV